MKLFFIKNAEGEIEASMQVGTSTQKFCYITMLQQLFQNNNFEEPEFTGFEEDEKVKIKELLSKINTVIEDANKVELNS